MELQGLEDLNSKQEKLVETAVFIAKLLVAGLVFRAVLHIYPSTIGLQTGLAQVVTLSLDLLGHPATLEGITVSLGPNSYIISQDCLGWKSVAALIGLSFASGSLRKKTRPVLLGVLFIQLANLIRIVSTIILTQSGVVSFEFIHNFTWRWLLTLTVLITWVAILKSGWIKQYFIERQ